MRKIWTESIVLAHGYDERTWFLVAVGWYDPQTGTLRIELRLEDGAPGIDPITVDERTVLTTELTREKACRRVIAEIDAFTEVVRPIAEAEAARDILVGDNC